MSTRSRAACKSASWTPEQWRVMRSPHRVHLMVALEALGDASVADLAALTGRTRQSLYPHLSAMSRAGIIGTSTRSHRARAATRYQYLPSVLARSVDQSTGAGLRGGADVSAGALRDAQIRCRRWGAVADGQPIDLSRNPDARTAIRVTWLDAAQRRRLNQLMRKAEELIRQGCVKRKGRRTCVLLYHFPDFTAGEARQAVKSRAAGKRESAR